MTQRLSRHFGTLISRRVMFTAVRPTPDSKEKQIWGVYTISPDNTPMVVQADLPLLGSFAGALVGLPAPEVAGRLRARSLDELLRDAIFEVLNIAGAVIINEHHIALSAMSEEKSELPEGAAGLLATAAIRSDFDVTIDGYQGGRLTVFS